VSGNWPPGRGARRLAVGEAPLLRHHPFELAQLAADRAARSVHLLARAGGISLSARRARRYVASPAPHVVRLTTAR
jgi:hypothetical protein